MSPGPQIDFTISQKNGFMDVYTDVGLIAIGCGIFLALITPILKKINAWFQLNEKKILLKKIWINSISQRHIVTKQNITEKLSLRVLIKIN